jgi:hypothetical protein
VPLEEAFKPGGGALEDVIGVKAGGDDAFGIAAVIAILPPGAEADFSFAEQLLRAKLLVLMVRQVGIEQDVVFFAVFYPVEKYYKKRDAGKKRKYAKPGPDERQRKQQPGKKNE